MYYKDTRNIIMHYLKNQASSTLTFLLIALTNPFSDFVFKSSFIKPNPTKRTKTLSYVPDVQPCLTWSPT